MTTEDDNRLAEELFDAGQGKPLTFEQEQKYRLMAMITRMQEQVKKLA
jgi:hypothetical protein